MTTMILTIDDKNQDLVDALKVFVSKFNGVSFQIEKEESDEEVLDNFRTVLKDIKSGKAIENAKPIEELYKELENG